MKNWITKETADALNKNSYLPLRDLLRDSCFYPASGIDGSPIRHANVLGVNSFVYVDTSFDKNTFDRHINDHPIRGYHIYGIRELQQSDLIPDGWSPQIPEELKQTMDRYIEAMKSSGANHSSAFARWIVFKRDDNLTDEHGPDSLSLIYVRGEGIATYQALYIEQDIVPKIFAIIRPGTGWGGNFTMFEEFLYQVMKMHPKGLPPQLLAWHSLGMENNLTDPIFQDLYPEKILGPLSKDNEPQNDLSLFVLKNY